MPSTLKRILAVTLFLQTSLALAQPPNTLHGYVLSANGNQVPHATVGINGLTSKKSTDDKGEFVLEMPATMQPGLLVTFYVEGWIVIDPCFNGQRGTVPLPSPQAGTLTIKVARRGDKVLISDSGIRNLLLGIIQEIHARKATSFDSGHALGARYDANSPRFTTVRLTANSRSSVFQPIGEPDIQLLFRSWINKNASSLGITGPDIESAIRSWINAANSDFDRGLGDLYLGKVKEGISLIEKSAANPELRLSAYSLIGTLYSFQNKFAEAENYFQKAIDSGGDLDPDLFDDLSTALALQGKSSEAKKAVMEAIRLIQSNHGIMTARGSEYLTDLSHIEVDLGEMDHALQFAFGARSIGRDTLPPGDPERVRQMVNLVVIYAKKGQTSEAERVVQDEVNDILGKSGQPSERVREVAYYLAGTRLKNGRLAEAEKDIKMGDQMGTGSESSLALHNELGVAYMNAGSLQHAKSVFAEILGDEHKFITAYSNGALQYAVMINAGEVDYRLQDYESAAHRFAAAAALSERKINGIGLDRAWRLQGDCFFKLGKKQEADELYQKAYERSGITHFKPQDIK
jgi:tetratricopeptide (TPR) repeat protein